MFNYVTEETIQNHSDREIMESHGFAQVYESALYDGYGIVNHVVNILEENSLL